VTETNNSNTRFYPKGQLYNCRCSQSLENFQDKATLGKPRGKEKISEAIRPAFISSFIGNIIHPKYRGKNVTDDEYGTGMDLATKQHATVIANLVNYKAEA